MASKAKIWDFLNSNFGLFMMSSIVLSFITWSYAQWTDSLEKEKIQSEKFTMLETELSYRLQVMNNYFESECAAERRGANTLTDIGNIYRGAENYKAIFAENSEKDPYTLHLEDGCAKKRRGKAGICRVLQCFAIVCCLL
jgi:hypothetical protein